MTKDDYIFIRNYAWDILIISQSDHLPIDLQQIADSFGVHLQQDLNYFKQAIALCSALLQQIGLNDNEEYSTALAIRIIAPIVVLQNCDIKTYKELENLTLLPEPLSRHRFDRIAVKKDYIGMSSLERRVGLQFNSFCNNYKTKQSNRFP